MRTILCLIVALSTILALGQSVSAQSGLTHVWAVDDGEKVKRGDLDHRARSGSENAVWDGQRIRIFGARNEIVAFQLILEAAGSGASQLDVQLDTLHGPSFFITNETASEDPFDFRGRHIELFLEHYINVTQRSLTGGAATWSSARPLPDSEHLGWIPDALIPFQATPGTADWIGGAPFQIGPGRTQAVWVDITIPRQAPPGIYSATVRVTEQGSLAAAIPLELEVYNFTLPDSTHLHNMFHIEYPLLTRHPGISNNTPEYWALFRNYMKLAHRHRMDLTDGRRPLSVMEARLKGYYTGEFYTSDYGYDGPGRGVGNTTYSIGTYDQFDYGSISGFEPATQEGWWAASDAWEAWFQQNAPEVVRFKYMKDEPDQDTTSYEELRRRAEWIHSNPGPGKALLVYCTVKLDPRLFGAIDFWGLTAQCGYDHGDGIPIGYCIESAQARRALGERVGIYNGTRPAFGLFEWIDNFATDPRITPWITWKYNVDQYFLWETGYVYNQKSLPKQNPWITPIHGADNRYTWGMGTVLYTGNDNLFPGEDRGIDGPIASIRIKNWRRGQQDYEYLWLAQQAGVPMGDIVDAVVPAAFDDYSNSSYQDQGDQPLWATRGYRFEGGRRDLAALLGGTGKTTEPPTGTFSSSPSTLGAGGGVVTLSWSSTNASSASIDRGIGAVPLSGSTTITIDSSTTFTLTLVNADHTIQLQTAVSVDRPMPGLTGSFRIDPSFLPNGGGEVTLSWSSENAAEATIDNGIGPVAVDGSVRTQVITSKSYTLTLRNASSVMNLIAQVTVDTTRIPPSGVLVIEPAVLPAGGGLVSLSWTSAHASSALLNNGIGPVAVNGSTSARVQSSTVFVLTLINGQDTSFSSASVTVENSTEPPSGSLHILPAVLSGAGGEVTLIWSSTGGSATSINNGVGSVQPSGSRRVFTGSSTTYTLTVMGPTDTARVSASVTVLPMETPIGVNVLSNGGFEGGTTPWVFSTDGQGSFVVDTPGCGTLFGGNVQLSTVGTETQLYQTGFPLDANARYRLSFDGCSSNGGDLEISIHKHEGPFTNYGLQSVIVDLRQTDTLHQVEFTTTGLSSTVTDARLRLSFSPHASPGELYRLDNFTLMKVIPHPPTLAIPSVSFPSLDEGRAPVSFTVTWSPAAGAVNYHLQVASDVGFEEIVHDASTPNTYATIGPLDYDRTYYFRIRSLGAGQPGPFSSIYAFSTVAIPDGSPPPDYVVVQNYPNPFNGTTRISFTLPTASDVRLIVYDILGREVRVLASGPHVAGLHTVPFSADDLPSGIYFYWFKSGSYTDVRKMMLVR